MPPLWRPAKTQLMAATPGDLPSSLLPLRLSVCAGQELCPLSARALPFLCRRKSGFGCQGSAAGVAFVVVDGDPPEAGVDRDAGGGRGTGGLGGRDRCLRSRSRVADETALTGPREASG